MISLEWAESALEDLGRIDQYLGQYNPDIAVGVLDRIITATNLLFRFPSAGPIRDERTRSLRVQKTPYILVYTVRGDAVSILHIYHERQNWRQ